MLTISTLADVRSILKDFPPELLSYMENHFKTLYRVYCSNGSPPLEQFSLSSVGEILLAHSYNEIRNLIFEDVQKETIGGDIYYICSWVRNNDRCCEVYICENLLSPKEIKILNEEIYHA